MKIDKKKIIDFFDTKNNENSPHSSAINGLIGEDLAIGLLKHYFENKGSNVTILNGRPKKPGRQGNILDGWISVLKNGEKVLYQLETKNWCSHSSGGQKLTVEASDQEIKNYSQRRWNEHWDSINGTLKKSVNKVLQEMPAPSGYTEFDKRPLICFWLPITNSDNIDPFFEQELKNEAFKNVYVFSMSNYLRKLQDSKIELNLPNVDRRLAILKGMLNE